MFNSREVVRKERFKVEVVADMIVGRGDYSLPVLYLLKVNNILLVMKAKKGVFPKNYDLSKNYGTGESYYWQKVCHPYFDTIGEAINKRKVSDPYLDNYTFLISYCLGKEGVDITHLIDK
tara:strand:- start:352 stop:711 length:360 start_codon:yes stop_codon:yes gene_type:complete